MSCPVIPTQGTTSAWASSSYIGHSGELLTEITPSGEHKPWVQPTGAHDAYGVGDQVTHKGKTWTSTVDANVWEPGTGSLWVERSI